MDEQGLLITPESSAGAPRQVWHCSMGALFQLFPSVGRADLAFPILMGCSFRVRGKHRQHKGGLAAAPQLSPPAKGIPRASQGLPEGFPRPAPRASRVGKLRHDLQREGPGLVTLHRELRG